MRNSIILLFIFINSVLLAEDNGIQFEQNVTWQQILDKAKKENKFIFLDAYTSWCGPCKMMSNTVFTKKEVGDSINPFYISVKFDMEKDEGLILGRKYHIQNYPSFLFFDSNGNLVHQSIGYIPAHYFIELCIKTLNPENQYITLRKKFLTGNKDTTFLKFFIEKSVECNDSLAQNALKELLRLTNYELSEENAAYIDLATNNITDTGFIIMLANKEKFNKLLGKDVIDYDLEKIVNNEARSTAKKEGSLGAFKKIIQKYLPEKKELLTTDYELSLLIKEKNWKDYFPKAEKFASEYCKNDRIRLLFIASNYLYNYKNKTVYQKGLIHVLRSIEIASYHDNNEIAARLYSKLNDKENAKKYAEMALAFSKEHEIDTSNIEQFLKTLK